MNEVTLGRIEEIKIRLKKILSTIRGKFSIEQKSIQDQDAHAVLLKIYQQSSNNGKGVLLFMLVIDEGLNIGVCSMNSINAGYSPFYTKRSYSYHTKTFAPWIKAQMVEKLAA